MMLRTVSPIAAVVNFSPGSGCLSVVCAEQRIPCLNVVRTDEQRRLVLSLIRDEISKRVRNGNDERFYRLPAAPPDVSPKPPAVTVLPPDQTVVPPVPVTTVVPPVPPTEPAPVTTVPGSTAPKPKQSQSDKDSSSEDSESSDGEDVEK